MPCYHPLTAFQTESGDVVFSERGKIRRELTLRCGQCVGCKLERSRQWAVRCMHEASMFERNSFVTLTYDDDHLPYDSSLDYRHFQLFMKRLRKRFGSARFYMCGEYGEHTQRPHFHACLFGVGFDDAYPWRKSPAGFMLKRSPTLEKLWIYGSCEIGEVTFESAAYVARYILKKVTGNAAEEHYRIVDSDTGEVFLREPEFTRMSLKPGIGFTWFEKFKDEVFPLDRVVVRGFEARPPRYYKDLLDKLPGTMSDDVDYSRYLTSLKLQSDNTEARLRVKEVVARARIKSLKRSIG